MTTRADGDVGDRVSGATLDDFDDFAGTAAAVVRRSSGAIGSSLGPPFSGANWIALVALDEAKCFSSWGAAAPSAAVRAWAINCVISFTLPPFSPFSPASSSHIHSPKRVKFPDCRRHLEPVSRDLDLLPLKRFLDLSSFFFEAILELSSIVICSCRIEGENRQNRPLIWDFVLSLCELNRLRKANWGNWDWANICLSTLQLSHPISHSPPIMHRTYSMRATRAPTASQVENPHPPLSTTKSNRWLGKGGLGKSI